MSKSKVRNIGLVVFVLLLCYVLNSCVTEQDKVSTMGKSLFDINEKTDWLNTAQSGVHSEEVVEYFEYYGLDFENEFVGLRHIFGRFTSGDNVLVGHIYEPIQYKATVILAHGYFNHCGQLNHLIRHLLGEGFAVAAFDFPGHGLSSGERVAIDDFAQYGRALVDFTDEVKARLNGPYNFAGHSTGGSAMIDYLLTEKDTIFDKVVLVAPLVHCAGWEISKMSSPGKFAFVEYVPRVFRKNSSDKAFLDFVKNKDPLQSKQLSLRWLGALHSWNDKLVGLDRCDKEIMVIQGAVDDTVDWRYNIKFLRDKFSEVQVNIVEGGRHELLNESAQMREGILFMISSYLRD